MVVTHTLRVASALVLVSLEFFLELSFFHESEVSVDSIFAKADSLRSSPKETPCLALRSSS